MTSFPSYDPIFFIVEFLILYPWYNGQIFVQYKDGLKSSLDAGTLRDKTMDDKSMYINDYEQEYPFSRLVENI